MLVASITRPGENPGNHRPRPHSSLRRLPITSRELRADAMSPFCRSRGAKCFDPPVGDPVVALDQPVKCARSVESTPLLLPATPHRLPIPIRTSDERRHGGTVRRFAGGVRLLIGLRMVRLGHMPFSSFESPGRGPFVRASSYDLANVCYNQDRILCCERTLGV